jgi:hypothetical protein
VTAAVFVVLAIALGAVAAITAIRSDPPLPRHRFDGDLIQERWDRRRTDRWT